jgi:nucleoid DNA-binding protein
MKIGKYISELLFTNDFVILAGFGEFSTKYVPARFVPEKKKVEAPSKEVTFNSKNKTDDNVLAESIAKKENKTALEVKEFITTFVSEMTNSLKSGKKVELDSIGQFALAPNGEIDFTPDKSINYLDVTGGQQSIKEPEKKTQEEAKTEVDKIIDKTTDDKKAQPTDKPSEVKETRPLSATSPIKPTKERSGLSPMVKLIAFLFVPLLVIGVILIVNFEYLFGDKAIDFKGFFDKKPKQEIKAPVRTVTEKPIDIVTEEKPAEFIKPSLPEPGRKVYYIIVGSFEEEHNAQILVDELKGKGAGNARTFPRNPLGFYRVSYDYYYDLREAEQMLTTVHQSVSPEAWILHR